VVPGESALTVAEELNFGRAAERLLIAGPSLSQQIKALEHDLGVRLFGRDRRSVALTPAGAALLPHTRALLERAETLNLLVPIGPNSPLSNTREQSSADISPKP
jgi:DNA-binding transcriptional LysR family regulator